MYLVENETLFEGLEVEEKEREFCEGVDGLLEIALESEMSWNNIVLTTIKEEYNAIRNESPQLLGQSKENLFQKIIAWVKEKAKQVAAFFQKITAKLMANLTNVDKFVGKYGTEMGKLKESVTVNCYDWNQHNIISIANAVITGTMGRMNSIKGDRVMSKDEISKEFFKCSYAELSEELPKKFRSSNKRDNRTLSAEQVKKTFASLRTIKADIAQLKNTQKSVNIQLSNIEKLAKNGLAMATKGSKEVEIINNKINIIKNLNALTDKYVSISISLAQQYLVDCIMICRAGVAKVKGVSKAAKKEKDKDAKDVKFKKESVEMETEIEGTDLFALV